LPKKYIPADHEPGISAKWDAAGAFHADPSRVIDGSAKPYTILIPPPNVTAALHLGHALNNTLQDILARAHRMKGYETLWMPGTDHAGIATQTVVDKRLKAEGKDCLKHYKEQEAASGGGRDAFIAEVQKWKDEYESCITGQLKAMGCSCDWDRQAFTMDEPRSQAVREAFFRLFKDGLIYRGKRLVNWDPVTQTALADDEVEMEDVDGNFYYLRYPVCDADGQETGDHVTVATTRPETMLGDTAVAVNPDDPPRAKYVGQFVKLPIVGRVIPIIADDYVVIPDEDSDDSKARMASGFLKVTPAHDPNDYDIGQRHDLPIINVMAPDASISTQHGWPAEEKPDDNGELKPLLGLSREDARREIVKWFKAHDLLEKLTPYRHAVGHSYRSHVPVEPYYSDQWYLKVTDDRMKGNALRAMDERQREPSDDPAFLTNRDRTSRDRQGAGPTAPNHYLITFTTYGTWLHGRAQGSADDAHNLPGTPYLPENAALEAHEREQLQGDPQTLDQAQRPVVRDTLQEVCRHRGWSLLAANIRSNHVHAVVAADDTPEKTMNAFKSYATRRLTEADLHRQGDKLWTRHGSTRYLNDPESVERAKRYVLEDQGDDLGSTATDNGSSGPLPDGRGSSDTDLTTGLRFNPPRYAKTFQTWHENLRDWCISRQLWWGHRIPVWSITTDFEDGYMYGEEAAGLAAMCQQREGAHVVITPSDRWEPLDIDLSKRIEALDGEFTVHIALVHEGREDLESAGFTQDPDVLDTWFSSALWPMSTLGWPEQSADLELWNPTSVLCTAREIITLWVSRMVMFNLYFRGTLPFKDVFIHAMIQDGHGQKMSKSLGNGVDPNDIIHTHGADAMRFTLTSMTTHTQDVRMPVDVVDPHTRETFTPKFITTKAGHKVAAPVQQHGGQEMVSSYGAASGEACPCADRPLARNTSEKFDLGQRFANKMWNATRFALTKLVHAQCKLDLEEGQAIPPSLPERWILSRLARTVRLCDDALQTYAFADYANALYDFFWRDLCDWYIEAVKPRIGASSNMQRTLAACLDASLRLLHPIMPFVTERLWEALNDAWPDTRSVDGLMLQPSELLVTASWPQVAEVLIDGTSEAEFERIQETITAIRDARNRAKVPPRETIELSSEEPAEIAKSLTENRWIAEGLANFRGREFGPNVPAPEGALVVLAGGCKIYLHGLCGDASEETDRLTGEADELRKAIANFEKRLSNTKYVEKAPAHLVQETRDQLAATQKQLETIESQLAALA
ncbi:MAG: valine--tRNA ligase, partial [Planctomycetota bacterium]